MTNEPYVIGGAMKDPVLQAIETAKWCDGAVLDPTIKTPTMTYIHGANKQIEAIRSAYIAERQRLEQRIAELEAALKLAMVWLEDEVPKYIVDELINSLR